MASDDEASVDDCIIIGHTMASGDGCMVEQDSGAQMIREETDGKLIVDHTVATGDGCMVEQDSGAQLITEETDEKLIVHEAMEFESEEAARLFYSRFATQQGFAIRKGNLRRSKDGTIYWRQFVCFKEGEYKGKSGDRANSLRQNCPARMQIKKRADGKWVVVNFLNQHNHDVATTEELSNRRLHGERYPPFRTFEVAAPRMMGAYQGDGSQMANSMSSPPEELTHEFLGETSYDASNHMRREMQKSFGPEAQELLNHFSKWQISNPTFVFAVQVDDDQCLSCVFWADDRARMSYSYFSDVVVFDTTCKMNGNKLVFAQFSGVNNHAQPIFLGGALMALDCEASFIWIFRSWLNAMHGRQPGCIITDREETICAAVSKVFPQSCHRLCTWRILEKTLEKLSNVYSTHSGFYHEFHECIYKSRAVSDFEKNWMSLFDKYVLHSNEWLQSLYAEREHWVPAYVKGTFSAGLLTRPHGEGTQSLFDKYIDGNTTLGEFIKQYGRALQVEREREDEEVFKANILKPDCKTPVPMEQQAAEFYTRIMFVKFQKEFIESLAGSVELVNQDESLETYSVKEINNVHDIFTVTFNCEDKRSNCSCQLFESEGILCRHVLTIFKIKQVFSLPHCFILKRWRKDAKIVTIQPVNDGEMSTMVCFNAIFSEAIRVANKAVLSKELMVMQGFKELGHRLVAIGNGCDEVAANIGTNVTEGNVPQKRKQKTVSSEIILHDTTCANVIGQISDSGVKFDSEKRARLCNEIEYHDRRN